MTRRATRKLPPGRATEVAALLRALAERVEAGLASANFRIEISPPVELWLVAASVPASGASR